MTKKLLYEISIIRPLIIFLLVVYHALCVFTKGWVAPDGVPANSVYWWLGHLISGFRIETIAFVGGYVFSYQCIELSKRNSFGSFVWKKFKRLIIPCFVFGVLYYLLFRFNPEKFSWNVAFWKVANGIEHLWFLPMLFWCFLLTWAIDWILDWIRNHVPNYYRVLGWLFLLAFAGLSLLRVTGLRFGLTRVPYFIFYFYLGYWIRAEHNRIDYSGKQSVWLAVVLWVLYLFFVLLHQQATHYQMPGCTFHCPQWLLECSQLTLRLMALGHTFFGILALYVSVMVWLDKHKSPDSQPGTFLRSCSKVCYGVYVLHMFFMKYLYYYSPLPQWCCETEIGTWIMPWLVLILTLVPSVVITMLLLKTRFGRMLIG